MQKTNTTGTLSKREQNRSDKRTRLLTAALTVFSRNGYTATTMDSIAAEAGLTKPTLYQYFNGKDELFHAMMLEPREMMMIPFDHSGSACHVEQLWDFSWVYAKIVMQPEYLALARLVIGDAQRSPEIGRAYQASGPDRVRKGLAAFMSNQAVLGRLSIEDAELAAEDFWGLILSAPRNKALHIPDSYSDIQQISKYIINGIKIFLKAYSTNPKADLQRLNELVAANRSEKAT